LRRGEDEKKGKREGKQTNKEKKESK